MACATLKRAHNFDLLNSTPKKRRFHCPCATNGVQPLESPFVPSEHMTQAQLKRRIKEELKRLQRRRLIPRFLGGPHAATPTVFVPQENINTSSCNSVTSGFQFMALRSPHTESQDSDSDQSPVREDTTDRHKTARTSLSANCSVSPTPSAPATVRAPHYLDSVPIFTLPQVTALCDRLIHEREEQLRQEYDSLLSCKLAEQYEAFLKFNHDQLYRRFQNTPMSYVS